MVLMVLRSFKNWSISFNALRLNVLGMIRVVSSMLDSWMEVSKLMIWGVDRLRILEDMELL